MEYHLQLCFDKSIDQHIKSFYETQIDSFNSNKSSIHQDSGFDLFISNKSLIDLCESEKGSQIKLDHKVSCAVYMKDTLTGMEKPSAYYMYPRSSISKTPFRLANSVGIIDSGYRGNLIAKVDRINNTNYTNEKNANVKLFQITSPTLEAFTTITICDTLDKTSRGSNGFGSTG